MPASGTRGDYLDVGAPAFEDSATSSRIHAPRREGFRALLDEAAVGDTVRVADAARLFRSVGDVLEVRDVLRRRGLHLRVASGAWSGLDFTSDDPMTKLFVTMLAGVLEFQRDMISENTREGVAAAAASGTTLGRPPALDADQTAAAVRARQEEGVAVKELARRHSTSPRTIRRVLAAAGAHGGQEGLVAALTDPEPAADETPVVLDVPGLLADHLTTTGSEDVRAALAAGRTIRRGTGYSVRVTAPLANHQAVLEQCGPLAAETATPAARKAYRAYTTRLAAQRPATLVPGSRR